MDIHRAAWNQQHHELKLSLSHPDKYPGWYGLFLHQHAQVHSSELSEDGEWSVVQEVMQGMDVASLRSIPARGEHSIAWVIFHLARIEDVTMNMLVAGDVQLAEREGWLEKMRSPIKHTGNLSSADGIRHLSQEIDISTLRAYRLAVGRRTEQVVAKISPTDLCQRVSSERIETVRRSGAVAVEAGGILDYWSKRTIAGLLLMPPTRHCFLHLNEALKIKYELLK